MSNDERNNEARSKNVRWRSVSGAFRISTFGLVSSFDIRHSSFKMTADMDARLAIDTAVLLLYFFGIVALGLWAGRRNKNLRDFSLGGRSIPWWAVLASIVAAETSAATFLGTPAEGFKTRGYFYGQLVIGTILARVIIAYTFIKPYYA